VGPNDGQISAGAAVGIAVAAVAVLLCALFAASRRRRRRGGTEDELKQIHSPFTMDEDEDDVGDVDTYVLETTVPSRRMVHVMGEDDSLLTDQDRPDDEVRGASSIMSGPMMAMREEDYTDGAGSTTHRDDGHDRDHRCSSPNCRTCEERRQGGITFVRTYASPPAHPEGVPQDAIRDYVADDTVFL